MLIVQLVERRGIGARVERADALSLARILTLAVEDVTVTCLCYLDRATSAQIGYAVRRIRRKAPHTYIVVSLFGATASVDGLDQYNDLEVAIHSLESTVDRIVAAILRIDNEHTTAILDAASQSVRE
jgi:hypothetical protein